MGLKVTIKSQLVYHLYVFQSLSYRPHHTLSLLCHQHLEHNVQDSFWENTQHEMLGLHLINYFLLAFENSLSVWSNS